MPDRDASAPSRRLAFGSLLGHHGRMIHEQAFPPEPASGAARPPVSATGGENARAGRPVSVIRAELGEVRRHLVDAPPHHGAGIREALHRQLRSLEHELARVEHSGG